MGSSSPWDLRERALGLDRRPGDGNAGGRPAREGHKWVLGRQCQSAASFVASPSLPYSRLTASGIGFSKHQGPRHSTHTLKGTWPPADILRQAGHHVTAAGADSTEKATALGSSMYLLSLTSLARASDDVLWRQCCILWWSNGGPAPPELPHPAVRRQHPVPDQVMEPSTMHADELDSFHNASVAQEEALLEVPT
ncbi:hypothetical protein Micbo1qcDRAFT_170444 [Microdochium bolleyi]|uniref:Uncharacterized protein n=1 Tax=Microdochium bolleyi TaxID=196109 RepID=A0A136JHM0_9PEZI|nr:hypothetical protein Micbo1qcDRAFT_170444 [Microdochium bolleyi]